MTAKDVAEIMRLLEDSSFDELDLEVGELKLSLRRGSPLPRPSGGPLPRLRRGGEEASPPPFTGEGDHAQRGGGGAPRDPNIAEVESPLLGVFYRAPKPGEPPFVEVGAQVEADTVVAIIEVMKLMNSVRAGVKGEVIEICVDERRARRNTAQPLIAGPQGGLSDGDAHASSSPTAARSPCASSAPAAARHRDGAGGLGGGPRLVPRTPRRPDGLHRAGRAARELPRRRRRRARGAGTRARRDPSRLRLPVRERRVFAPPVRGGGHRLHRPDRAQLEAVGDKLRARARRRGARACRSCPGGAVDDAGEAARWREQIGGRCWSRRWAAAAGAA